MRSTRNLKEPLPCPKKGRQYTKGNPLNVRLSCEKKKQYGKPLRAKYRIVVLGNFGDRLYQKFQHYALKFKT